MLPMPNRLTDGETTIYSDTQLLLNVNFNLSHATNCCYICVATGIVEFAKDRNRICSLRLYIISLDIFGSLKALSAINV